jgi:hypothetical protein
MDELDQPFVNYTETNQAVNRERGGRIKFSLEIGIHGPSWAWFRVEWLFARGSLPFDRSGAKDIGVRLHLGRIPKARNQHGETGEDHGMHGDNDAMGARPPAARSAQILFCSVDSVILACFSVLKPLLSVLRMQRAKTCAC